MHSPYQSGENGSRRRIWIRLLRSAPLSRPWERTSNACFGAFSCPPRRTQPRAAVRPFHDPDCAPARRSPTEQVVPCRSVVTDVTFRFAPRQHSDTKPIRPRARTPFSAPSKTPLKHPGSRLPNISRTRSHRNQFVFGARITLSQPDAGSRQIGASRIRQLKLLQQPREACLRRLCPTDQSPQADFQQLLQQFQLPGRAYPLGFRPTFRERVAACTPPAAGIA